MEKIYTHNGVFHADEVTAVALLQMFKCISLSDVVRVPHQTAEFEDARYVLDIGRILDPSQGRFDHHQYKHGLSSAGLVYEHVGKPVGLESLITLCDENDTGIKKCGEFEYPNMISRYNSEDVYAKEQDESFFEAVAFASKILWSLHIEAKQEQELLNMKLEKSPLFEGIKGVLELPGFIKNWQSVINGVLTPDIHSIVYKDDKGDYCLQKAPVANGSFNFSGEPYAPDESMEFVHTAGFFAVAKSREVMKNYLS